MTIFLNSCASKPTDLRTLVPAETLVYLETNDLGSALQPIVDSKPFNEVAKKKPDLSALKGVQLAVAITGFETSEERLTDEHSVGKIQPHFVAVADTHAWHFQAVGFAEQKIGAFVAQMYGSEPTLEKPEKNSGRYLTWTAKDGRKAYAFVIGSVIYFTNDETAIDKCLAVSRGEADSIVKTGKVQPADPATLASGYISTDGVAQIANLAALKFASDASDESEVQSAIAGILPQLIRRTVTDATWKQTKTDAGIEDNWQINMPAEVAAVFNETMARSNGSEPELLDYLPQGSRTASLYSLRDPKLAFRSVRLILEKQLPSSAGSLLAPFLTAVLSPYGVADPERFLSSIGPSVVTANDSDDGDKPIVVATITNPEELKRSVVKEAVILTDPKLSPIDDGAVGVSFLNDRVHVGDGNTVLFSIGREAADTLDRKHYLRNFLANSSAPIATYSYEDQLARQIKDLFRIPYGGEPDKIGSVAIIETRFNRAGMERKTTSDFGFIGWIIAQLNED